MQSKNKIPALRIFLIIFSVVSFSIVTILVITFLRFFNYVKPNTVEIESTLYSALNEVKNSEENRHLQINTIKDSYKENFNKGSHSRPDSNHFHYERSSTLNEKLKFMSFGEIFGADILGQDNKLNDYNDEAVVESQKIGGTDCPTPKTKEFSVREDYELDNLNLHVEMKIKTEKKYIGWPTSNYCYFKSEVVSSSLFYGDKEIYKTSDYLTIQGGKKIDGQKIIIDLNGKGFLYSFDNGQNWHQINNSFYISSYKFKEKDSIKNHTLKDLNQEETKYYENLLSTENFWQRSFGVWEGASTNIAYMIKDIAKDGEYTVLTFSDDNVECLKKEIGKNSFYERYCDRKVYFYTDSGKLDAVKTIESIDDFPEEIKNMKGREWSEELAAKYIRQI